MRKLLNVLYVLSEDAYLSLNGETVEVSTKETTRAIPLHTLEAIVCFSYKGASPALLGKCAGNNILCSFYTPNGKYLASVCNNENGNVYLRREQFRIADDEEKSLNIVKSFLSGKLYNTKYVVLRYIRDHPLQVNAESMKMVSARLSDYMRDIGFTNDKDSLRGIEGNAAAEYFGIFNEMILQNKGDFIFDGRNRRPPLDNVNSLLSLTYSILSNECASALRSVGLDPFVGFLHTDRPGRKSLALDLMEELRAPLADRFVLSLINNRVFTKEHFKKMENGAVILKDDARKIFFTEWQNRKKDEIVHPFLEEKISWGLVPYVQSMLLARTIRGDLDAYPPFFWK